MGWHPTRERQVERSWAEGGCTVMSTCTLSRTSFGRKVMVNPGSAAWLSLESVDRHRSCNNRRRVYYLSCCVVLHRRSRRSSYFSNCAQVNLLANPRPATRIQDLLQQRFVQQPHSPAWSYRQSYPCSCFTIPCGFYPEGVPLSRLAPYNSVRP